MKRFVGRAWRPDINLSAEVWRQADRRLGLAQQNAPDFESTVRGVLDGAANAGRITAAAALIAMGAVAFAAVILVRMLT